MSAEDIKHYEIDHPGESMLLVKVTKGATLELNSNEDDPEEGDEEEGAVR
jgi:hypothetical protein